MDDSVCRYWPAHAVIAVLAIIFVLSFLLPATTEYCDGDVVDLTGYESALYHLYCWTIAGGALGILILGPNIYFVAAFWNTWRAVLKGNKISAGMAISGEILSVLLCGVCVLHLASNDDVPGAFEVRTVDLNYGFYVWAGAIVAMAAIGARLHRFPQSPT